ncbi:MAG: hypothetical protein KBD14_02610, partial [Candidatus Pacebacteria bacterium]|nr:hypothetical protein [Candidatus Paceibacterota bacterium]
LTYLKNLAKMGTQILESFVSSNNILENAQKAFKENDIKTLGDILFHTRYTSGEDRKFYPKVEEYYLSLCNSHRFVNIQSVVDFYLDYISPYNNDIFLDSSSKKLWMNLIRRLFAKIRYFSKRLSVEELLIESEKTIAHPISHTPYQSSITSHIEKIIVSKLQKEKIIVSKLQKEANLYLDYLLKIYKKFSGRPLEGGDINCYDYNGLLVILEPAFNDCLDVDFLIEKYVAEFINVGHPLRRYFFKRINDLSLEVLKTKKSLDEIVRYSSSWIRDLNKEADEMILSLLNIDNLPVSEIFYREDLKFLIKPQSPFPKSSKKVKEVLRNSENLGKFKSTNQIFELYVGLITDFIFQYNHIDNLYLKNLLISKITPVGIKGFLYFAKKHKVPFLKVILEELIKNENSLKRIDSALSYIENELFYFDEIKILLSQRAIILIDKLPQLDFEILLEKCIKNNYFYGNKYFFIKKAQSFL